MSERRSWFSLHGIFLEFLGGAWARVPALWGPFSEIIRGLGRGNQGWTRRVAGDSGTLCSDLAEGIVYNET